MPHYAPNIAVHHWCWGRMKKKAQAFVCYKGGGPWEDSLQPPPGGVPGRALGPGTSPKMERAPAGPSSQASLNGRLSYPKLHILTLNFFFLSLPPHMFPIIDCSAFHIFTAAFIKSFFLQKTYGKCINRINPTAILGFKLVSIIHSVTAEKQIFSQCEVF